ncbi:hypothetical protein V8B97DRAFT_405912 [Scleroderma yunnanense]
MYIYCWDHGLNDGRISVSSELKTIKTALIAQCNKGNVEAFENTCFRLFVLLRSKPTLTVDEKAEFVDLLWLAFGMYESYVTIEVLWHSDKYSDGYFRGLLIRLVGDVLHEPYLPSPIMGPLREHLEDLERRLTACLASAAPYQVQQNNLTLSQELDFWMAMLDPLEGSEEALGASGVLPNTPVPENGSSKQVADISGLKRRLSAPNVHASASQKSRRPLTASQSLSIVTSSSEPAKHVAALKRTFSMSAAVPQSRKQTKRSLTPILE